MRELSLNILDIAENSVKAGATLIGITVSLEGALLTIRITDNGKGMDEEFLKRVTDPFTTTRTTRKVGLGLPLIKMESEMAGGTFGITSKLGEGTTVTASFDTANIDCLPLGDLGQTVTTLIAGNSDIRYVFVYEQDGERYEFDTLELKEALGDFPMDDAEILSSVEDMVNENINTIKNGGSLK